MGTQLFKIGLGLAWRNDERALERQRGGQPPAAEIIATVLRWTEWVVAPAAVAGAVVIGREMFLADRPGNNAGLPSHLADEPSPWTRPVLVVSAVVVGLIVLGGIVVAVQSANPDDPLSSADGAPGGRADPRRPPRQRGRARGWRGQPGGPSHLRPRVARGNETVRSGS
ncbi:hypothetical protein ACLQ26_29215 [Micromonospora sp. DT43]|uniref:hypothetical protein n=1 Tax=Micromonospora sp. DT43 TaxID=3393440 RepID=UPI003CF40F00